MNVIRPIPFIILIAALGPALVRGGYRLGVNAAVFAMSFGAAFAIARIVEQNMVSIDPGVIEAARAMGASKLTILFTVMIPEALGPLILAFPHCAVVCPRRSGYVGAGVLGKIAIVDGYRASTMRPPGLLCRIIIAEAAHENGEDKGFTA